jgi:repressor LexA
MKSNKTLSKRQLSILKAIRDHTQDAGWPPSLRDIRDATPLASQTTVRHHVVNLAKKGYVKYEPRVARGLSLTRQAQAIFNPSPTMEGVVSIPLAGNIVASQPVEVDHDTFKTFGEEDAIQLSAFLLNERKTDNLFALKVRGDSMIDAMINDGDIVVMQKPESIRDGDMVAVWLSHGETTLKHIYQEGNRIRLQPASPLHEPIYVNSVDVTVQGKVLMVLRNPNPNSRKNGRVIH